MGTDNNGSSNEEITKFDLDAHRAIVMWLFLATSVITVLVAGALIFSGTTGQKLLSILPVVVLAGVLGAFVSALNRIYSSSSVFPLGRYKELMKDINGYLIAYSSIPPLVGAISATVLYVLFAGQIITGPFFPTFACENDAGCNEFQTFLQDWSPDKAQDYAKAIVWGFIAGFSERFVPDILNRVVNNANEKV
ncbi:hypothetical protein G5S52_09165 [Grimontia sp. S25]|uniref:Uncharacterized protein n=1 Tax=Grimontia sedimenti TaxID=2711294 RepID=A0A6M1RJD1_9GAMM|nr:hypothetical protein [Grimontia sedimenti]NGN97828.1 hypothetical protein [Grimontia sedimenti]